MREKKKERTIWKRLKTWMRKRYTTTCSLTESKTQEKSDPFYVDGQMFWEAENDIIDTDEREIRKLRTN